MYRRHPRGGGQPLADIPAATARLMRYDEIERFPYEPGGLYLGMSPIARPEDWPLVQNLMSAHAALTERIGDDPFRYQPALEAVEQALHALSTTSLTPIGLPPREDRHSILFAGTRGGKGTSLIVPNLCLYPGSVLCIDPKGENAEITVARRGQGGAYGEGLGQETFVFDPYEQAEIDPAYRTSWNFLTWIDLSRRDAVERASTLADAIILPTEKAGDNKHFDDNARILLKALILYICQRYPEERSVARLHRFATIGIAPAEVRDLPEDVEGFDPFHTLLHEMLEASFQEDTAINRVVGAAASALLDMGDNERGSVLSTMRTHLEFMERESMQTVFDESAFDPRILKNAPKGASVYLVLPPGRMSDTAGWLRLMISVFLETLYADRAAPACGHPILFMLDEFAVLRRFKPVEQAAGYGAGYHIRLFLVLQDLPQLKAIYTGGAWETFLGNSGCIMAFDVGDNTTAKYLSDLVGQTHIAPVLSSASENESRGASRVSDLDRGRHAAGQRGLFRTVAGLAVNTLDDQAENYSHSVNRTETPSPQLVPVLQPDEIVRLFGRDHQTMLVLRKGYPAMDIARGRFFEHPFFKGKFDGESAADPRIAIADHAQRILAKARSALDHS